MPVREKGNPTTDTHTKGLLNCELPIKLLRSFLPLLETMVAYRCRARGIVPARASTKVTNWLPRPGKARVTYAEGSSFEGVFNGERIKEGSGKYTWMKPAEDDEEDPQVRRSGDCMAW